MSNDIRKYMNILTESMLDTLDVDSLDTDATDFDTSDTTISAEPIDVDIDVEPKKGTSAYSLVVSYSGPHSNEIVPDLEHIAGTEEDGHFSSNGKTHLFWTFPDEVSAHVAAEKMKSHLDSQQDQMFHNSKITVNQFDNDFDDEETDTTIEEPTINEDSE